MALVAIIVFFLSSIFSRNNHNLYTCQVFCFTIHIHKRYPPYVIAASVPKNMYHVYGILFPVHQKLVCFCRCPPLLILALCVGILYIIYHIYESGIS